MASIYDMKTLYIQRLDWIDIYINRQLQTTMTCPYMAGGKHVCCGKPTLNGQLWQL